MEMSKKEFETLTAMCRKYDLYTNYIEDFTQKEAKDEANACAGKVFDEILLNYNITAWIGNFANKGDRTEEILKTFIKSYNVSIEEEPAKQPRVWSQEEIKQLIQTNDKVLYGALKKLYAEQTADEQRSADTKERNNAGFNSIDAKFLTSAAEFLKRTGFLTDKQKVVVRKKLVKYTRQLTRLANA